MFEFNCKTNQTVPNALFWSNLSGRGKKLYLVRIRIVIRIMRMMPRIMMIMMIIRIIMIGMMRMVIRIKMRMMMMITIMSWL